MSEFHKKIRLYSAACLSIACLVLGCGQREPEVEIDQGRALEVMRSRILLEPVLFERTEYNPTSEMVAEKWIDPSIKKGIEQRNFGHWPRTEREANRLADILLRSAWSAVLDAPEGRALIEQQMRKYWENPKIEVSSQQDSVEMNLGVTPGTIEITSRGYYSIQKSEFESDFALIPSELVRRLKLLQELHPMANRWRVSVIVRPYISRQNPITYEYRKTEDRLFVYSNKAVYYSPARLEGKLDRLLTGESPIQSRDMKILPMQRVGKPFVLD
jgi:hypothetical protein